ERFLVVADLQGRAENARIASAVAIAEEDVVGILGHRIEVRDHIAFDATSRALRARRVRRLGAIALGEAALPAPTGPQADAALAEAVRRSGPGILPWREESLNLRARLAWLHRHCGAPWPDMADTAL